MQIIEMYHNLEQSADLRGHQIVRGGSCEHLDQSIIVEHLMDVYINEILVMKLVCTPQNLADLVLGRMLSEGMIQDVSEVECIYICEYGRRAKVMLSRQQEIPHDTSYVETSLTCCTGNRLLSDYFVAYQDAQSLKPIPWKTEWVWTMLERFKKDTPLHQQTGSTHSSFLMLDGKIMFQCEDIGRHNALDKAIGYALRNGIDLGQCAVYTTGRMPTDMVIKVIRAGIPVLISKEAPTQEAVELAARYQLTLIGCAKNDQMLLYAGRFAQDMDLFKAATHELQGGGHREET